MHGIQIFDSTKSYLSHSLLNFCRTYWEGIFSEAVFMSENCISQKRFGLFHNQFWSFMFYHLVSCDGSDKDGCTRCVLYYRGTDVVQCSACFTVTKQSRMRIDLFPRSHHRPLPWRWQTELYPSSYTSRSFRPTHFTHVNWNENNCAYTVLQCSNYCFPIR